MQRSSNGTFSTELFSQSIQRVSIWTECFGEKLMKGVSENKPTLPKQISTWDVNTVLKELELWTQTDRLTRKELTLKLCMLLALCSG